MRKAESHFIIVRPTHSGYSSNDAATASLNACRAIVADIKRHVDNVRDRDMDIETEYVCSHCESAWTERSAEYNGGCCDEDEKNNPDHQDLDPATPKYSVAGAE